MGKETAHADNVILASNSANHRVVELNLQFRNGVCSVSKDKFTDLQNDPNFKKRFGKTIGILGDKGFNPQGPVKPKVVTSGSKPVPAQEGTKEQ